VASVMKAFTVEDLVLHAFRCKRLRKTHHTLTFGIPL
jgi:hypothetical protein